MDFSQLHERLRLEMLGRIERGLFTSTDLARLAGFTNSHISNFLKRKRKLSLEGADKVLRSQGLSIADLQPGHGSSSRQLERETARAGFDSVPLVGPIIAAQSARIRPESIVEVIRVSSETLTSLRDRCSAERRRWDRFVAVRISGEDARLMRPALPEKAILLIDRHYNSALRYSPDKPTMYAVRLHNQLKFRYIDIVSAQLVLRAHEIAHVPELVPLSARQSSTDLIVGRVFFVMAVL